MVGRDHPLCRLPALSPAPCIDVHFSACKCPSSQGTNSSTIAVPKEISTATLSKLTQRSHLISGQHLRMFDTADSLSARESQHVCHGPRHPFSPRGIYQKQYWNSPGQTVSMGSVRSQSLVHAVWNSPACSTIWGKRAQNTLRMAVLLR